MKKYPCPICNRRACDSNKELYLEKFNQKDDNFADIVIKCVKCGNQIAVAVKNTDDHHNMTTIY